MLWCPGCFEGPEDYYSSSVQADPRDGEGVSQYAQLVWELHTDQEKTFVYFERVVEAAPAARYHFVVSSCLFIVYVHDRDDNGQDNRSGLKNEYLFVCIRSTSNANDE